MYKSEIMTIKIRNSGENNWMHVLLSPLNGNHSPVMLSTVFFPLWVFFQSCIFMEMFKEAEKQMKNTWLWNRVNEPSLSAWVFVAWLHRRYLFTALAIDYYSKTLFSLILCITFARKFEDCQSNFSSVVSSPSLKSFKSQDSLLISMSFINSCTAVKKYELGRIVSCKKSVLIYSSQSWLMLLFFSYTVLS